MEKNEVITLEGVLFSGEETPRTQSLFSGERWVWDHLAGPSHCEFVADCLQGLAKPAQGRISFLGKAPAFHRNAVGRIFCGTAFVSNLTIAENLRVAPFFERDPAAVSLCEERIRMILDACGIDRVCEERPVALSDTERCFWQWVRALSRPRDLFLFEDAFSLLPAQHESVLKEMLSRELNRGAALIVLEYRHGVHL